MTKLLVVIDMQEGFRYKESEEILDKVKSLKDDFDGKLVFLNFVNEKSSLFENQLNWKKFQEEKERLLFKELESKNNRIIFHKGYTILNEELYEFIRKENISEVYLCGIYTDVCIIKAAMDFFDNKIRVFVIEDACNSLHGKESHNSAINSLKHIIGKDNVISSKSL